ncbi:MAG: alpha/beta hydrolase [Alteraurantiacibacter sp.]
MTGRLSLLAACLALFGVPAQAAEPEVFETVVVQEWVEPAPASRTVAVDVDVDIVKAEAIAAYGPFRVLDESTAALVDITDENSPSEFAALLEAHPGVDTLTFVEAPGTHDDRANLAVGRMIRAAGLATVAPEGGSIRSGAVELFIAGAQMHIADGSEFAVHGWLDDWGMGADDYAADAPEHRRYLDYYSEMGMNESEAEAFYAMTNSVPFESALWLTGEEMRGWVQTEKAAPDADAPALAYADLAL